MQYRIKPPLTLNTAIELPSSKSISNRALVIAALAKKATDADIIIPQNLSVCDDTEVITHALEHNPYEIDIKAAGTAMRFMTAYLSVCEGEEHIITGTERMKHRPIRILVDNLRQLGAEIEYIGEEGYPPLRIHGRKLNGGEIDIDSSVSSQYISALLMIGPMLKGGLTMRLIGSIASRPYIDLTLHMMREFGAEAEWTGVDTIVVKPTPYRMREYVVENDWSAASYWYEMMTIMCDGDSKIELRGLFDGSRQGDSAVRHIFSLLGIKSTFSTKEKLTPSTITLTNSKRMMRRLDYDFTNQPDLAQTLVCTCLTTGMHFNFRGLASLKIKETDRIEALKTEMRKMGFVIYDYNDSELRWDGERCDIDINAVPTIDTYDDHRMAMAIAPMAIIQGSLIINNPEVVSKSYPQYWDHLRQAGFTIEEIGDR